MTDIQTAEGPSPEVAAFAAGIEAASGGTVLAGFTWGWTSRIANDMPDYELTHRDGTGIDLDCIEVEADVIATWASTLDVVHEVVVLEQTVHLTLGTGTVDLSGCPKPKKKKATEEPAPE